MNWTRDGSVSEANGYCLMERGNSLWRTGYCLWEGLLFMGNRKGISSRTEPKEKLNTSRMED